MTFQQIVDRISELSNWLHMVEVLDERPPGMEDGVDLDELVRDTEIKLDTFVRSLSVGVLYRLLIILYMSKGYFENPTFLDAYDHTGRWKNC
jgi:hypothetical protein